MKGYLVLRLEGPLQSWGERSFWNQRDTALIPTKSGIMGLLGCAFKYSRGNPEIKKLSDKLSIVTRVDRTGSLLEDFHIVTGNPMLGGDGTKRSVGNTIVTRRYYLQDAFFTVFLIGEKEVLYDVKNALDNPGWSVYLGRKSCIPTRPVLDGEVKDFISIESMLKDVSLSDRHDDNCMVEAEASLCSGTRLVRNDRIVGNHEFSFRDVVRFLWKAEAV